MFPVFWQEDGGCSSAMSPGLPPVGWAHSSGMCSKSFAPMRRKVSCFLVYHSIAVVEVLLSCRTHKQTADNRHTARTATAHSSVGSTFLSSRLCACLPAVFIESVDRSLHFPLESAFVVWSFRAFRPASRAVRCSPRCLRLPRVCTGSGEVAPRLLQKTTERAPLLVLETFLPFFGISNRSRRQRTFLCLLISAQLPSLSNALV